METRSSLYKRKFHGNEAKNWTMHLERNGPPRWQKNISVKYDPRRTAAQNRRAAEQKLSDTLAGLERGSYVEASRLTFGRFLQDDWLEHVVKPTRKDAAYRLYRKLVETKIVPAIGERKLQQLLPLHLKEFYAIAGATLAPATVRLLHAICGSALKSALLNGLVSRNAAKLVDGLPRITRNPDDLRRSA
jgi:integrase